MELSKVTFEEVTTETAAYLKKMGYSQSMMSQYHAAWNHLKTFMSEHGELYFTAYVAEAFIYDMIGNGSFNDLKPWKKQIATSVNTLTEYMETKSVKFRRCKIFRELNGPVGLTMLEYVRHRRGYGISATTEDEYRYHLGQFIIYLNAKNIASVVEINKGIIIDYANSMGFASPYTRHRNLSVLKGYLYFLYENNLIETDISKTVPKCKRVRQPKLPSTYTRDEVERLIGAIDRSSPKGKRDYAMILITARLGLRATDVCDLKFNSLLWEQNLIIVKQNKTGQMLELPLLAEIGEAIIDYLKYGRPKSELPYVFLHVIPPYDRLNRSTLHSIICLYMRLAGIKFENRRHGPHALRHSLAGILLERKTPVPVISEVLGHLSTESTRYYLRIDIDTLRQCAIDVPPVSTSFYGRRARS
jgi:site-specific recombinase XerD